MGGPNCDSKAERKKGPWTREEDQKMMAYIQEHGHGSWRNLPTKAGLKRCGKSCRLRWTNYLRPDIKRGKLSTLEEEAIIRLHALLGNRWSCIAALLPKRTDNEIKNYWNTRLKKRLTRMGINPQAEVQPGSVRRPQPHGTMGGRSPPSRSQDGLQTPLPATTSAVPGRSEVNRHPQLLLQQPRPRVADFDAQLLRSQRCGSCS